MALEGYTADQNPDPNWWMEQIHAGEEYRKRYAYQNEWAKWRSFYRGDFHGDILPVNLFFMMLRSIVPRIYFRNPSISIAPAKPGLDNMAFARVLERIDNKLMKQMRLKKQMKKIVQDTFLKGTGWGKMGFGGFYTPAPKGGPEDLPIGPKGSSIEYRLGTADSMPWFARVDPRHMIVPHGLVEWEDTRWVAQEIERPIEDVRGDPRFENTKGLKATSESKVHTDFGTVHQPQKMVKLYEVRDTKTGNVFVIAPNKSDSKILHFGPDTLQIYRGLPFFPNVFNEDDETFWGLPDAKILESHQLELNEVNTQIMKHRRLSIVKILAKAGAISEPEVLKMLSEDVSAVVQIMGNIDDIELTQSGTIPDELFVAKENIMQDVREAVGFSRNQFGEFNSRSADTTATEANIVRLASEIRIDERRDGMADLILDAVEVQHGIIFDNWREEQVVDLIGPGGVPIWVKFRGDLLKAGRYNVKVDPDSSIPETRAIREQRAIQLYQILVTNPTLDPFKLTQFLLHELKGAQFDDMMRMLPPAEGTPEGPIDANQLGDLVQQSIAQVSNGASPTPPTIQGTQPDGSALQ